MCVHRFQSHPGSAPWLGKDHISPRFWKLIPKHRNGRRVLAEGDPNSPSLIPLPSLEGSKAPGTESPRSGFCKGGSAGKQRKSYLSSCTRAMDWGGGSLASWATSAGSKLNLASQNFHFFQHQMSQPTHALQCLFQTSHSVTEPWPSHAVNPGVFFLSFSRHR